MLLSGAGAGQDWTGGSTTLWLTNSNTAGAGSKVLKLRNK